MDIQVLRHAALGAAIAGGGVTAVQSLLARKISRPSSLAISVATLIGTISSDSDQGMQCVDLTFACCRRFPSAGIDKEGQT